jgi:putative hydrolase of the HAD superfamily
MHRAIIFDFDGLIVDTETVIYESWNEVYYNHGESLELETYKQCVGSDFGQFNPETELEQRTGKTFDWPTINTGREELIRQRLATQDARPGVREFIENARAKGLKLAVASSSSRTWVAGWLEKLDILKHFGVLRNRDDVERIKPHPDLFLAAAEALDIPPGDSLVMEDSENGLRAAKAAGMPCVIVTNPVTAGGQFNGALLEAECFTEDCVTDLIR